jgi:hypothetical protein
MVPEQVWDWHFCSYRCAFSFFVCFLSPLVWFFLWLPEEVLTLLFLLHRENRDFSILMKDIYWILGIANFLPSRASELVADHSICVVTLWPIEVLPQAFPACIQSWLDCGLAFSSCSGLFSGCFACLSKLSTTTWWIIAVLMLLNYRARSLILFRSYPPTLYVLFIIVHCSMLLWGLWSNSHLFPSHKMRYITAMDQNQMTGSCIKKWI